MRKLWLIAFLAWILSLTLATKPQPEYGIELLDASGRVRITSEEGKVFYTDIDSIPYILIQDNE